MPMNSSGRPTKFAKYVASTNQNQYVFDRLMAKKKTHNGRLLAIIGLIATVITLVIAFWILSAMGEKSGVEFSPDDFSMRSFNYCNLPIINWTRRGIKHVDYSNSTATTLVADGWIRKTGRTPKRWHLVSENGGFSSTSKISTACDARFLTDYFDFTNGEGENTIAKWTDDNPTSAKVYWPLIADMARDKLYLPIPGLMEFVLDYPEPDKDGKFAVELMDQVADAWYQGGMTDQLNGRHDRAIERFDIALSHDADHPLAEAAKATSEAASQ